jgi:hypothetical protein
MGVLVPPPIGVDSTLIGVIGVDSTLIGVKSTQSVPEDWWARGFMVRAKGEGKGREGMEVHTWPSSS